MVTSSGLWFMGSVLRNSHQSSVGSPGNGYCPHSLSSWTTAAPKLLIILTLVYIVLCDPQPGSQTPERAHPISPAETRGTEKGLRRSSAAIQDTLTRDPQCLIRCPSPSGSPYHTVSSTVTVFSPYTGNPSKYHLIISDRPHIWVGIGGRAKGSRWLSDSPGSLEFKNGVRGAH